MKRPKHCILRECRERELSQNCPSARLGDHSLELKVVNARAPRCMGLHPSKNHQTRKARERPIVAEQRQGRQSHTVEAAGGKPFVCVWIRGAHDWLLM